MLGTLFKYEWKGLSRMLLVIHGCVLLFSILSRFLLKMGGGVTIFISEMDSTVNTTSRLADTIFMLLIFSIIVVIAATSLFTFIYIGYRFYKKVFTDQGYLTNTLPVTPSQILLSHGMTAFLWTLLDMVILILCACIVFLNSEFISAFLEGWRQYKELKLLASFFVIMGVAVILSPILRIIQLYFSIAAGSLFTEHKVLGSIGIYTATYVAMQLSSVFLLSGIGFFTRTVTTPAGSDYTITFFHDIMNPALFASSIFSLVCAVIFWFAARHIMTKNLNLQ